MQCYAVIRPCFGSQCSNAEAVRADISMIASKWDIHATAAALLITTVAVAVAATTVIEPLKESR
eukprot:20455-Heterococcus_DN1.PRE.2